MSEKNTLEDLCINTIRLLSIDAVQRADSGHPGMPMGAAPMAYVLWTRFLRHNPRNPQWFDRDRFILSAGHGSMLLYSLLYLTGYGLSVDDLKQFRQWNSRTPGHPERNHTPGVEVTTGPLGQGFANGVGMAMVEKHLAARYNRPGHAVIDHYTYAICSDGDMMEGVSSEAAAIAGHLQLGKLIYLYDYNLTSLAASTALTHSEDTAARFRSLGWHTAYVENGNDTTAIKKAIEQAKDESKRPSLIIVRTVLGYGSPGKAGSFEAHGSPLGEEEVRRTKENLGWPVESEFYVPEEVLREYRKATETGTELERDWEVRLEAYRQQYPREAEELLGVISGQLPEGWADELPEFPPSEKGMATRAASESVLNAIAPKLPALIGGAADLAPSTKTTLKGFGDYLPPEYAADDTQGSSGGGWSFAGRNIHFGVREHAMGGIANGMAAHGGAIPFVATFLIFSDYMRPAIRLAAITRAPVKYVFTHDSIALGEDGPTHQPVEHLVSLRAMPNLIVIRPADANETVEAWRVAIETQDRPVALILTRQHVPVFDRSTLGSAEGVRQGAYILREARGGAPDLLLIATGSEVALALQAARSLEQEGIAVRVVSMPSWELFDAQPDEYRQTVLPPKITARLAVEAGSPVGWERYVGSAGDVIGVTGFGASAPGEVLLREYGFTVENVIAHAKAVLKP